MGDLGMGANIVLPLGGFAITSRLSLKAGGLLTPRLIGGRLLLTPLASRTGRLRGGIERPQGALKPCAAPCAG